MDSLRSLASPTALVIRAGNALTVPSAQVCLGDIVEVKTGPCSPSHEDAQLLTKRVLVGDVIPADLRIVEAMNFETDEALLTGESLPVAKDAHASWTGELGGEKGEWDPTEVGVGGELFSPACFLSGS